MASIARAELIAALRRIRDEVGPLDLGEDRTGDRGAEGVAAERRAVGAGVEELARGAEGDERADREAAADALGDRDRVGGDALVLEGEPLPRAPGAGLDLVDDQQRAVPLGDFARRAEEPLGQREHPGLALDGLDEERGDPVVDAASSASTVESMNSTPLTIGRNGSCIQGLPVSARVPIVRPWNASRSDRMRGRSAPP